MGLLGVIHMYGGILLKRLLGNTFARIIRDCAIQGWRVDADGLSLCY